MIASILNPVFVYECILTARRWQTYAFRTAFLGILLISLVVVWEMRGDPSGLLTRNSLARVGESFFFAIAGTQLVLALLAAPAYAAGSICVERARGTLMHMLVTDLSATEIVLGKLAARILPLVSLVLTCAPAMVLATLLGGVEPEAVIASFVVTVAVTLVTCTLALALSVWVSKPHEVLLATYVIVAVWLLAYPLWEEPNVSAILGAPPQFLRDTHPFALVFAPYSMFRWVTLADYAIFVGLCLGLTAVLTLFAIWSLRWASQRVAAPRKGRWRWPRLNPFQPTLDFNPILWREWRRRLPSRWMQMIWGVYVLGCVGASLLAVGVGGQPGARLAAWVSAFQFSIGLLLVLITSVAALFEERVNGGLDMLLATPLLTSSIVAGKWIANFRRVVPISLIPLLLTCICALRQGQCDMGQVLLLPCLMLGYGAVVTSLGLALSTWIRRFAVAMGVAVAVYVLIAAVPVLLALTSRGMSRDFEGLVCISPWCGVGVTTYQATCPDNVHGPTTAWNVTWLVVNTIVAFVVFLLTNATFDRCLGRMSSFGDGVRIVPLYFHPTQLRDNDCEA